MKKLLPVLIILFFACHNTSVNVRKKDSVIVPHPGDSIKLGDVRNVTTTISGFDEFVKDSSTKYWTRVKKKPHNTVPNKYKTVDRLTLTGTAGQLGGQLMVDTMKFMSDVMVYDSTRLVAYQKKDSTMVIIGDSATVIRVLLESMDWTRRLKVKYPAKK